MPPNNDEMGSPLFDEEFWEALYRRADRIRNLSVTELPASDGLLDDELDHDAPVFDDEFMEGVYRRAERIRNLPVTELPASDLADGDREGAEPSRLRLRAQPFSLGVGDSGMPIRGPSPGVAPIGPPVQGRGDVRPQAANQAGEGDSGVRPRLQRGLTEFEPAPNLLPIAPVSLWKPTPHAASPRSAVGSDRAAELAVTTVRCEIGTRLPLERIIEGRTSAALLLAVEALGALDPDAIESVRAMAERLRGQAERLWAPSEGAAVGGWWDDACDDAWSSPHFLFFGHAGTGKSGLVSYPFGVKDPENAHPRGLAERIGLADRLVVGLLGLLAEDVDKAALLSQLIARGEQRLIGRPSVPETDRRSRLIRMLGAAGVRTGLVIPAQEALAEAVSRLYPPLGPTIVNKRHHVDLAERAGRERAFLRTGPVDRSEVRAEPSSLALR